MFKAPKKMHTVPVSTGPKENKPMMKWIIELNSLKRSANIFLRYKEQAFTLLQALEDCIVILSFQIPKGLETRDNDNPIAPYRVE